MLSGCLTHARRRFDAALTELKKDFTKEQLKETVAYQAMSRIGILYKIEDMIYDKTPEERYEEHQKQSRPVMNILFEWLHTMEDSVDSSFLIGDAILYTLNQEVYLRRPCLQHYRNGTSEPSETIHISDLYIGCNQKNGSFS